MMIHATALFFVDVDVTVSTTTFRSARSPSGSAMFDRCSNASAIELPRSRHEDRYRQATQRGRERERGFQPVALAQRPDAEGADGDADIEGHDDAAECSCPPLRIR